MTAKILNRPCPVCSHDSGDVIHVQEFVESIGLGSPDSVEIVSCARCGCGFSNLSDAQEVLDKSYEEHSKYADMSVFGQVSDKDLMLAESPWDLERLTQTAQWLTSAIEDRSCRILDAGCATGTLIGLLKRQGFDNLVGLDPSPLAAATTAKHYKVPGIAGSFCSPPPDMGEFDVVVLSHVLEHIADVKAAADGLASMVKPNGLVYLEVPDAVRYADFLVAPYHDFNNEHINHFSLERLDQLLAIRGFDRVAGGAKEVPIAPNVLYPAAFGLWKKTNRFNDKISFDHQLRSALDRYITESAALLHRINEWLSSRIDNGPIALWGAGNLTVKLLRSSLLSEANIISIVDGSKQRQGINLNGIVVADPTTLSDFKGTIVIMSLHHAQSIANAATKVVGRSAGVLPLLL